MSRINDQLAAMTFDGDTLNDDELITDVLVIGRVTRMSDGRGTVIVAQSDGIDIVTKLGLLMAGQQITDSQGWCSCDDDEDDE